MTAELSSSPEACFARAQLSLKGLSVGDAFGERFFGDPAVIKERLSNRQLPPAPWAWTDDTAMALGIVEVLKERGSIDQDRLAAVFGRRYAKEPYRGYGGGAARILSAISRGGHWHQEARKAFDGQGSHGNGGAMRAAPVGAYFAFDSPRVVEQARLSAEITHAHPEGQAGAIAVALAAAWAARSSDARQAMDGKEMLTFVIEHSPESKTRTGIETALSIFSASPKMAAINLGNGSEVSAADTVPFSLWCAARHLDNYEEALWTTVSALGDRDTTCAIVGGIVALSAGVEAISKEWKEAAERAEL